MQTNTITDNLLRIEIYLNSIINYYLSNHFFHDKKHFKIISFLKSFMKVTFNYV